MTSLLVDTDVLIDHLRRSRELRPGGNKFYYSVVTRAELYVGGAEREVDRILDQMTEIDVDRAIAQRAGRIRRNIAISFQDATIAATGLQHRLTVLTRNVRDFSRIPKLRVRSEVP